MPLPSTETIFDFPFPMPIYHCDSSHQLDTHDTYSQLHYMTVNEPSVNVTRASSDSSVSESACSSDLRNPGIFSLIMLGECSELKDQNFQLIKSQVSDDSDNVVNESQDTMSNLSGGLIENESLTDTAMLHINEGFLSVSSFSDSTSKELEESCCNDKLDTSSSALNKISASASDIKCKEANDASENKTAVVSLHELHNLSSTSKRKYLDCAQL
jgi:hypothetical protein